MNDFTYLRDINLSLKAKGLLTYLLNDCDENITAKKLSNHLKESEKQIYAILKELHENCYISKIQKRNTKNGTFGQYKYKFSSTPFSNIVPASKYNLQIFKDMQLRFKRKDFREIDNIEPETLRHYFDVICTNNYLEFVTGIKLLESGEFSE